MKNQQGITLIELLVTITILSIVGILIWGTFLQGTNYSNKAVTKNQMQQESNYIISRLTKIHQTSKSYEIKSTNCKISVTYTPEGDLSSQREETFENINICFSTSPTGEVNPNTNNTIFEITVQDNKNLNNKLSIETILYRLKSGG